MIAIKSIDTVFFYRNVFGIDDILHMKEGDRFDCDRCSLLQFPEGRDILKSQYSDEEKEENGISGDEDFIYWDEEAEDCFDKLRYITFPYNPPKISEGRIVDSALLEFSERLNYLGHQHGELNFQEAEEKYQEEHKEEFEARNEDLDAEADDILKQIRERKDRKAENKS